MNPKVSVCISVHNTAKFLPRCLDSVVNQTIPNLEIILVDNGSTDSSLSIMKDYKDRNANINIKIITQDDRGLAQGRQTGVDNATGDYITFLDADDYVDLNAYEIMYKTAIKVDADIIEIDSNHGNTIYADTLFDGLCSSSEILMAYFHGKIYPMIWMRMYKRNLFEYPVFPQLYVNNEDIFAFPCLMSKATNIYILHKPLHYYTIDNIGSYMNKMKNNNSSIKDYYRRLQNLQYYIFVNNYLATINAPERLYKGLYSHVAKSLFSFVNNRSTYFSFKEKIQDVINEIHFNDYTHLNTFIKSNIYPDSALRLFLKIFGISFTYRVVSLFK